MAAKASLNLARIVLDTTDAPRAAKFWAKALGYGVVHKSPEFWAMKHPTNRSACRLGLQVTDERKPASETNRLHFEVFTDHIEREAKRLVKLGATRVPDWPYYGDEGEINWIVMRDPDGHEFCIVEV